MTLASIPPLPFAALRVVMAAGMLEFFRRLRPPVEAIAPEDRRPILLFALLGVSINQVLFILGLSLSTAIHTTILTAMIPVFTLAAAVTLGREKLTPRAILALILAAIGGALLLTPRGGGSEGHSAGNLLLLANGLAYSLYLVLSRPVLARYRVATFVAAVFRYGALPIVLVALPWLLRFDPSKVPSGAWASFAGIVVLSTVMPYLLNSWALARTDASRVAFYVFFQPLISSLLAVAVLGETLSAGTLAAGLLILAGLAVSVQRRLPVRPVP